MKKPILFVVYISIACCVGFIAGAYFDGFYSRDIVGKVVTEYNDVQELFEWYKQIIFTENVLSDLDTINNINDLESIKEKYREYGLSSVDLFKDQAISIKRNAVNSKPIIEFEKNIEKYEEYFKQTTP